ncbi:MAG: thioredoxin family protein [Candidatus Omnitrophota bacterium]
MKKYLLLVLAVFILGCTHNQSIGGGNIDWYSDLEQAKIDAQDQEMLLLIDFYTDWCGWCKRLDKDTYANKEVAELAKNFVCVKINADKFPQLTKEYNVQGFPSTVYLRPDGTRIEVIPGYMPPAKFMQVMNKMLADYSE